MKWPQTKKTQVLSVYWQKGQMFSPSSWIGIFFSWLAFWIIYLSQISGHQRCISWEFYSLNNCRSSFHLYQTRHARQHGCDLQWLWFALFYHCPKFEWFYHKMQKSKIYRELDGNALTKHHFDVQNRYVPLDTRESKWVWWFYYSILMPLGNHWSWSKCNGHN